MLRLIGLLRPARIVVRTLAPVLVASSLVAQQPYRTPIHRPAPPKPALQCFAIRPDTGSRPRFLPESLILGANRVGRSRMGFRAAAVSPDRIPWTSGDREDTLGAVWRAYGQLYSTDSIYVNWWVISGGPAMGELRAEVNGDSLSGRAVEGSGPGLPIHGRSTSCPPGR